MLNRVKDIIFRLHTAIGIEVCLLPDETMAIHSVVLSERKGNIVKISESNISKEIHNTENQKNSLPVSLIINGKGVLIKQVSIEEIPKNPIETLLPTSNPDDFYYEIHYLPKNAIIALIRKTKLQNILNILLAKSYKILSVSIGGFENLNSLLLNLNSSDELLETSTYQFKYDYSSRSIQEFYQFPTKEQPPNTEYNIGDQYVKSDGLMSFAGAQSLLAQSIIDTPKLTTTELIEERVEFKYLKLIQLSIKTFFITISLLLLINLLLNNHITSENTRLRKNAIVSQSNQEVFDKRKKIFEAKNNILEENGWDHPSRISYFADRIASVVPPNIVFTEMQIFPIHYNSGFDGNIFTIQKDTIEITAMCADPIIIREFSKMLLKTPGIKNVLIQDYKYKKEVNSGIFMMQIEIQ